ncbi:MAG: hypothetical protein RIR14_1770 [Pseudomonadota bacterium]
MAGAGGLWQRLRFQAALLWQLLRRAPAQISPSRRTDAASGDAETLIEALQSGDLARLDHLGPALLRGSHSPGLPWFFVALESGSLRAVSWFLRHGASPVAPDRSGRLPLEVIIARVAAADEYDDHLPDCPAMARALIAAGADPDARNLSGTCLTDLAASAGLTLP